MAFRERIALAATQAGPQLHVETVLILRRPKPLLVFHRNLTPKSELIGGLRSECHFTVGADISWLIRGALNYSSERLASTMESISLMEPVGVGTDNKF